MTMTLSSESSRLLNNMNVMTHVIIILKKKQVSWISLMLSDVKKKKERKKETSVMFLCPQKKINA